MEKKNKGKKAEDEKAGKPPRPNHTHGAQIGAVAGEIAGGIMGAMAGPPGAVAGMVMGAAAGALAGKVMDQEAEREHVLDEKLDEEIGVMSGDLGAPNLEHPPARIGAFSSASAGGATRSSRPSPAEGPMSKDGDD